jgi:hypothetical protein
MSSTKTALVRVIAVTVLASLAAACGGGEEKAVKDDAATAAVSKQQKKPSDAAPAAAAVDDGLANAVAVGKTAAAVDLRYGLNAKPAVGTPFEVELAFTPRVHADSLDIEASGMPGLVIASGATAKFAPVKADERYSAKLLVQVTQTGLYYIGVTAKLTSQVQTDARTFSVPVVVGALPAAQKPEAAAAPGETVKSTPAVETTTRPSGKNPQP